jgi:acetyltransferase-like isoleucine patch superfamily enzyme
MNRPVIRASHADIADDCYFGDDVVIEAEDIRIAPGCRIGWSGEDDFRTPGGVRIKARSLDLGPGVELGRALRMEGGDLKLDESVRVLRYSSIRVRDMLHLGAYGTVGEQCEITGRIIEIGQELWMLPQAKIGGGSAFEVDSRLEAGHYLHLGTHTLVNTARPVLIGDEVGLGTRTSIYTHGAYPSRLMGFPVSFEGVEIGDFTWVPGAVINPGVTIGKNCVIGVNSLVTRSIPDGSLAAGSPAKVLRENAFPAPLTPEARVTFYEEFFTHFSRLIGSSARCELATDVEAVLLNDNTALYVAAPVYNERVHRTASGRSRVLLIADGASAAPADAGWTLLDTGNKRIRGIADAVSDRLTNELRRYGIRFYSRGDSGAYADWGNPKLSARSSLEE